MNESSLTRAVSISVAVSMLFSSVVVSNGQVSAAPGTNIKPPSTAATRLAPVRMPFVSDRSGNLYIYMMDKNGSQTRLTNQGIYDNGPSLSPAGNSIAFTTNRDGYKHIYAMNDDGSNVTPLTDGKADDEWPAWSPDGSKIAFTTGRDGNPEIYFMNASGSNQTRLTNDPANDNLPAWSPDGSKIAFVSDRKGQDDIYVMLAGGENPGLTRLTTAGKSNTFPAWSPDGSKIAFQSNRNGHYEIYVMDPDGTGEIRLTNTSSGGSYQPVWVDNGTKIAFTSDRGLLPEIYIMNADGTDQTRLTKVFAGSWTRGKLDSPPSEEVSAAAGGSVPAPNEGVITTFQPGHGFTYTSGNGTCVDDPTFFSSGNQSLKITTDGNGTQSVVTRTGISPTINITGEIIKLVVAVDNTENLTSDGQFLVAFSSNNFDDSTYVLYSATAALWQAKPGGAWVTASWSLSDAYVSGTPNLSAMNAIRIYVRDVETGVLNAWIQSISYYPPKLDHGIVSITFDDGYVSQYTYGLSKLQTFSYPANAYIIPDAINTTGALSLAQLHEMQNNYGWEISAHDYVVFEGMTPAQTEAELLGIQNYLLTNNLTGGQHFSYPGGYYDTNIMLPLMQKYFATGREAATGEHEAFPPANYHALKVITLTDQSNNPAAIATQVAEAINNKDWLILVFHNLVTSNVQSSTDYLVQDFNAIIDNIHSQGIAVKTISQVLAELDHLPAVTTNAATSTGPSTAALNGNLVSLGTAPNVTVSFEYGLAASYGAFTNSVVMTAPGSFSINITGLTANTTYHFRATANGTGNSHGFDQQFTTSVSWWNANWTARSKLALNTTGIGSNLTSFPMLVHLTPGNFDFNYVQADGGDLRFISSD
ncbi:MAG: polysaccharide deacetylase family protein, partial [Dehalococcoidales bacterium]|nr:polysaccharide deacetylase family protein [Dehalococcoidales bacterium]